jgi:GNAT superfamily N-acetyltransferase/predicted nucleic acid-binding protein
MDCIILSSTQDVLPFVDRIVGIADKHSDELGFLAAAAYQERVMRNQLWVAVSPDRKQVLGHLMFGGSQSSVKIVQLFVQPGARRAGIGSMLVGKLKDFARSGYFQSIRARVASDLASNQFWERQGFYIFQQVAGGSSRNRIINIRIHELPMNSLWGEGPEEDVSDWLHGRADVPLLPSPTYALDLNVLFDVIHGRLEADLARKVFSAGLHGDFRLCVSQELSEELERHSRDSDADPVLKLARELPTLPRVDLRQLTESTEALRRIVFPDRDLNRRNAAQDRSDLLHLAICHHHRVGGFVTREIAILRAASDLAEKLAIRVLSPLDIVNPDDALEPPVAISAVHFGPTEIREVNYQPSLREDVARLLDAVGAPASVIESVLEVGTSARPRTRLLIYSNTRLIACGSWPNVHPASGGLRAYLFVDEATPGAQVAIDHLLSVFLRSLVEGRLVACELITARSQLLTRSTASLLGFSRPLSRLEPLVGLGKLAYRGLIGPESWGRFAADFAAATGTELSRACPEFADSMSTGLVLGRAGSNHKRTIDLVRFETELSPAIILAKGRRALLVPIRDKLASELLPGVAIQGPLFPKEAGVRIEQAYFAKSIGSAKFERGNLAVFYVSKKDGGRGQAVGVARITSSGSGSPVQLSMSLLRQGVLSIGELEQIAGDSQEVGYFTFDSFTKFARPIPFEELDELDCIGAVKLVTSQPLEFGKLLSIIERSQGAQGH